MDSYPRIHQLSTSVINKIAAGEVIERPASVVKELLDNSVDALASRIEVEVVNGGSELIRIVDDGEGIHADDLLLAVTSHATSKITSAEDLFQVQTMGFRGEALASIAEVSHFRLRTRQADQTSGIELQVNVGEISPPQPCGCPVGTIIEVKNLFANTPVRRKFLKTKGTEFGHVSEQFLRTALAHPRLHFVLRHNNKIVYELPPAASLIDRLRVFYGNALAEKLIAVESEADGIRIWGFAAHPSESKSTRKGQYLFLNGRWIQDRSLQHALSEAYRGLVMVGRHPIAFLNLELSPELVDVNVHPQKSEVRFQNGQQLYRQLLSTLRSQFLSMELDTSFQVSGMQSNDSTIPNEKSPEQREMQMELATWAKDKLTPGASKFLSPDAYSVFASPETDEMVDLSTVDPQTASNYFPPTGPTFTKASAELASDETENTQPENQPASATGHYETGYSVMQALNSYLIAECADGVMIIDQHALHERILYEYLRNRILSDKVESQKLLVPETIELSAGEVAVLLDQRETLDQLGFEIEEFGKSTLLLTSYPVMLSKLDRTQLIRDILDQLQTPGQKPTRRDIMDELLHMMSCKAAIKAGQRLKPEEMQSLLAQRHLIDDAHHCPHGRPTAMTLSRNELDKQFGRLG